MFRLRHEIAKTLNDKEPFIVEYKANDKLEMSDEELDARIAELHDRMYGHLFQAERYGPEATLLFEERSELLRQFQLKNDCLFALIKDKTKQRIKPAKPRLAIDGDERIAEDDALLMNVRAPTLNGDEIEAQLLAEHNALLDAQPKPEPFIRRKKDKPTSKLLLNLEAW